MRSTHSGDEHGRWRRIGTAVCLAGVMAVFWGEWPSRSVAQQREEVLFDEVITAAAKHAQPAREAASQTTVVTADEIRRFGYRNLAEVLRAQRGFYGSADRNYDYIGVRGFLRAADYNDRILLLVNGHTYNDDIYQTALLGDEFGIDIESIERVEIVRGPGSALYGGNALFAVVNVITASGVDRNLPEVSVEFGSFYRNRAHIGGGHVFGNGVSVYASASVLRQNGDERLFYPEFDDPATNDGFAVDLDGSQALNFFAVFDFGNWRLQGGGNHREKDVPTAPYESAFNVPGNTTTDERAFLELQYEREVLPSLTVKGRAYGDRYNYEGRYPYEVDSEISRNRDEVTSNWFGAEASGRWSYEDFNQLTVGFEASHHPHAEQRNFDEGGPVRFDDTRRFTPWGVYLQNELRLPAHFSLVTGARFDSFYRGIRQANPRAALLWNPVPQTVCKVIYGSAFRPPNLYELYYEVDDAGASQANPDLDPERITTIEGVVEHEFAPGWRVLGAGYYLTVHDLIDQEVVDGALHFENIGHVHSTGGEFGVDAAWPRWGRVAANYSFQFPSTSRPGDLSNSPKHFGRVGLSTAEYFGLSGAAEMRIVGSRETLTDQDLRSVLFGSVHLYYQTPIPNLALAGSIYNFLDRRHFDPGGNEHMQDRIRQDDLTFLVRVRYGL